MTTPIEAKWQEHEGRLAVDANGYVWIVWPDGSHSMAPTNPDNSPTPQPFTFQVSEAELQAEKEKTERLRNYVRHFMAYNDWGLYGIWFKRQDRLMVRRLR